MNKKFKVLRPGTFLGGLFFLTNSKNEHLVYDHPSEIPSSMLRPGDIVVQVIPTTVIVEVDWEDD